MLTERLYLHKTMCTASPRGFTQLRLKAAAIWQTFREHAFVDSYLPNTTPGSIPGRFVSTYGI